MSFHVHDVARRLLHATIAGLLLALLATQAASSVCSAQCIQHQLGNPSASDGPVIAHCHSMLRPEADSPAVQDCPAKTYSVCVIDLLANSPGKTVGVSIHGDWRPNTLHHSLSVAPFTPAYSSLRSSIGDPPMITALRI